MEEFLKIEATSNQPPTSETSAPQHEIAPTESIAQPSTSTGVTPQKVQPTLIDLHTFMESTRTHTLSESVVDLTADDHSKNEVDADQPVVQSEQSRPKEATTTTATTQSTQQAATEGQTQRQLLQSVISVVLKMQQPGHGVVNAKEIKNAVATYCNQFGDNTQQVHSMNMDVNEDIAERCIVSVSVLLTVRYLGCTRVFSSLYGHTGERTHKAQL